MKNYFKAAYIIGLFLMCFTVNAIQNKAMPPILAFTSLPLPQQIFLHGDNVIRFDFTNQSLSAQKLGAVALTASLDGKDVSNWLTLGSQPGVKDSCSNQTLTPKTSCSVYVSLIPRKIGQQVIVQASLTYNNYSALAQTTANVIAAPTSSHTINFINQCPYDVWYGIANGSDSTHRDPQAGSDPDSYKLAAQVAGNPPMTKAINVVKYENGLFWVRTGCVVQNNQLVCDTGGCSTIISANNATGTCSLDQQPGAPITRFEAFISDIPNNDQIYNTSIINGFNVPVEVKGLGKKSVVPSVPAPFDCGASGAIIQPQGSTLGACSWEFSPPMPAQNFVYVSKGSDDGCISNANCTKNNICGMAFNSVGPVGGQAPINRRCGAFQGFWTIAALSFPSSSQWGSQNLFSYYNQNVALPAGPDGSYGTLVGSSAPATYFNMYGCITTSNNSLNTGYNPNTPNVCGCYDWDQPNSVVPTAQSAKCQNNNQQWDLTVLPNIIWLKKACPTAYAYQFDDKSSSFQCNPNKGGFTSYQITFCPGGKTGKPKQSITAHKPR